MSGTGFAKQHADDSRPQASEIAALRQLVRGNVVAPGDAAYDSSRRVWNGMIDRRPRAIVYCTGKEDVAAAVAFARSRSLLVAVRAGGHTSVALRSATMASSSTSHG